MIFEIYLLNIKSILINIATINHLKLKIVKKLTLDSSHQSIGLTKIIFFNLNVVLNVFSNRILKKT